METADKYESLRDPKPGTAAAAARDFGIDLTLTIEQLSLEPEERLLGLQRFIDDLHLLRKAVQESGRS